MFCEFYRIFSIVFICNILILSQNRCIIYRERGVEMIWIWLALLIVFIIIEVATVQLVTLWFAIGSLAALLTSIATDNIVIQVCVMLVVSALSLVLTRPFVKKLTKNEVHPTNADTNINQEGIVTEEINNLLGKGGVKIGGTLWTARSSREELIIPEGAKVIVEQIQGVKLIVRPTD